MKQYSPSLFLMYLSFSQLRKVLVTLLHARKIADNLSPAPAGNIDISKLVKSAKRVNCKPCAPVKVQWLHSLKLVPNTPPKGLIKDIVMRKFSKL